MSSYGRRVCNACFEDQDRARFSPAQWLKGGGKSRCRVCVAGGVLACAENNPSARTSRSASAVRLSGSAPFSQGGQRYVYHAQYASGPLAGTAAVAKLFKHRGPIEDKAFKDDDAVVKWALRMVTQFNGGGAGAGAVAALGGPLRLNVPELFSQLSSAVLLRGDHQGALRRFLVEPYVHSFRKVNSNSGFVGGSDNVSAALQALSHYSYHASGGMLVLCDLQCGSATRSGGGGLTLSDPVIMSRFAGKYGVTDLGPLASETSSHSTCARASVACAGPSPPHLARPSRSLRAPP